MSDGKSKIDKELLQNLKSDDENKVFIAIKDLRARGNSSYMPELLNLLSNTTHEEIYREITRLLCDIKDTQVIPYLIDGITDDKYVGIRNTLVSACWQSGMNFSNDLDVFVDIFLKEDYLTALEAFSVIEQSIGQLSTQDIKGYRKKLIIGLHTIAKDKKPLLEELINLME